LLKPSIKEFAAAYVASSEDPTKADIDENITKI
jgi:hypothetical protein